MTASPAVMRLRADFGLTKAEAGLALSLAAGASLLHAAEAYDVKLTTIRSQLQQIFAKIGTCRQAELVAMLLNQSYLDGARSDRAGAGPHAGPRPSAGLTAPPADLRPGRDTALPLPISRADADGERGKLRA